MLTSRNNFKRCRLVNLSHALHFSQYDMITFLIRVPFILVYKNFSFWSFFDHCNNKLFGLFTIMIGNGMLFAKINKCKAPWSKCLSRNIADIFGSAISIEGFWIQELLIDNKFSLTNNMNLSTCNSSLERISIFDNWNTDVWVQLLKFGQASLSSTDFANMLLLTIEVGS